MEHQHQLNYLTQNESGYIGYCTGCKSYNVAYKNSMFVLSDTEFSAYQELLAERVGMRPFFTAHGKEWLLITPMKNYFIMLSDEEINELTRMMNEAGLLMQVANILQASAETNSRQN